MVMRLPVKDAPLGDFSYLQLQLERDYPDRVAELIWDSSGAGDHRSTGVSGLRRLSRFSLGFRSGEPDVLTLVIGGQAGQSLTIEKLSLVSPSCWGYARALIGHWTTFEPWQHSSINRHEGGSSDQPRLMITPYVAATVAFVLVLYCLGRLLRPRAAKFNWSVPAGVFLAGWLVLDLLWQARLIWQLSESRSTYAGKSAEQKLLAGFDAELVGFTREVKRYLPAEPSRLLVASASDYLGMRGAYYLYPHNTYWRRHGREIPDSRYLHSGDYIVQISPSNVHFDAANSRLLTPEGASIEVRHILSLAVGRLFQVQ